MIQVLMALLLWSAVAVHSSSTTVHIYVSPSGNDTNDGRQSSRPVQTLHHVVNDMLNDQDISGNTVFVEMMRGYYDLPSTLHIPSLRGDVIFRSYQGQEVHVTGGKRLHSNQFHHVGDTQVLQRLTPAARARVLELDLAAAGLNDTGTLRPFGFAYATHMPLEVFINGLPLRLAEWPDNNFINIQSTPDGEKGKRLGYEDPGDGRDRRWAREAEPWVYGWWYYSWADSSVPVAHVDPDNRTISLQRHTRFGFNIGQYDPSYNNSEARYSTQGGYFRVINMLCELDTPGEYYVDRGSNKLYVWPNTPHHTLTSSDIIYASVLDDCITVDSQTGRLFLQDFTLEACRYRGVMMSSARNVTLSNMEVKNTGGTGILCTGDCRGITVMASDVHDVSHGIYLMGGDYQTLQSSHNVVRDNHIWHNARYGAFSNDAVTIEGVGVLVAHNHIHHGQYAGIKWRGNEHVMEYNHVHHMCWNSSDCGAFFTGRRWNWRGNVIRYNHVHDVLRHFPGSDVRGIMLDDEYSSALVEHNVFYNNDVHVNIGGGRDNVVRENIMYNAERYTMQVDARGLGSNNHGDFMREKLLSSPYRTELWKARYPELYDILDSNPGAPKGNQIYNNVIYEKPGTPETIRYSSGYRDRMDYFAVHDNHRAFSKAEFWSPDVDADFRLRCGAAQWAGHHSFQAPIALDQVGPTVPTGPANLQKQKLASTTTLSTSAPPPCDSTVAPSTSTPKGAYLPDGTSPNTLYPHIPNTGCWLVTDHCPSHPSAQGTHRDDAGTRAGTEEGCLSRASAQWHWCGAPDSGRVVAVYGPTGAMTFSAQGCYFAGWGCRTPSSGSIVHDKWAEQHRNASTDQEACLARAHAEWVYCGSRLDSAFTSVFGPTGAFRTAGGGCWIQIPSCPANPALQGFFFDAWGDSNRMTGTYQDECYDRASYYWSECGSHDDAPVTAFFRPMASKFTMPLTAN